MLTNLFAWQFVEWEITALDLIQLLSYEIHISKKKKKKKKKKEENK